MNLASMTALSGCRNDNDDQVSHISSDLTLSWVRREDLTMTNRISSYPIDSGADAAPATPAFAGGFAVCQLPQAANSPLAIQLLAQQQAYEAAILAAREEALRIALSRLQMSLN